MSRVKSEEAALVTASAIAPLEARMAAFMLRHPGTTRRRNAGAEARRERTGWDAERHRGDVDRRSPISAEVANHGLKLTSPRQAA
jgi:hypothetical protein